MLSIPYEGVAALFEERSSPHAHAAHWAKSPPESPEIPEPKRPKPQPPKPNLGTQGPQGASQGRPPALAGMFAQKKLLVHFLLMQLSHRILVVLLHEQRAKMKELQCARRSALAPCLHSSHATQFAIERLQQKRPAYQKDERCALMSTMCNYPVRHRNTETRTSSLPQR